MQDFLLFYILFNKLIVSNSRYDLNNFVKNYLW